MPRKKEEKQNKADKDREETLVRASNILKVTERAKRSMIDGAMEVAGRIIEDKGLKLSKFPQVYTALILRSLGLSYREIGKEMGVSHATVTKWIGGGEGYKGIGEESETMAKKIQDVILRDSTVMLSSVAQAAIMRIVELMYSKNEKVALDASRDLLDRIGLKSAGKLQLDAGENGSVIIKFEGGSEAEEWAK